MLLGLSGLLRFTGISTRMAEQAGCYIAELAMTALLEGRLWERVMRASIAEADHV